MRQEGGHPELAQKLHEVAVPRPLLPFVDSGSVYPHDCLMEQNESWRSGHHIDISGWQMAGRGWYPSWLRQLPLKHPPPHHSQTPTPSHSQTLNVHFIDQSLIRRPHREAGKCSSGWVLCAWNKARVLWLQEDVGCAHWLDPAFTTTLGSPRVCDYRCLVFRAQCIKSVFL